MSKFPRKILFIPIGWSDRGEVGGTWVEGEIYNYKVCQLCRTTAHVGREDRQVFLFCPKCLKKLV